MTNHTWDISTRKNRFYRRYLENYFSFLIPSQKKVLELGCGNGTWLKAINPAYGVGLDKSLKKNENADFENDDIVFKKVDIEKTYYLSNHNVPFDYVLISNVFSNAQDIQKVLTNTKPFVDTHTRIIIYSINCLWKFPFELLEKLSLKKPKVKNTWLSRNSLSNLLEVSGFQLIKSERKLLCPVYIPIIGHFFNRVVANLPLFNRLCFVNFLVARSIEQVTTKVEQSVSIIVPAKNEKGNIENVIKRTPMFGIFQEFIFVEGDSSDGTFEEINRVKEKYYEKRILVKKQSLKGKGNAVREGFELAKGDILMILDADLTTPPEELPKFYEALIKNKGEFINGCRLVYAMEKQAMNFLNLVANKFFGLLLSYLMRQYVKDTLCGTKVLWKKDYIRIKGNSNSFGNYDPFGDFDLLLGASKLNLKIIEIYVRYKDRTYGSTQISRFKDGLLLFRMCWLTMKKVKFI